MGRLEHRIHPPIIAVICAIGMWGLAKVTPVISLELSHRQFGGLLILSMGFMIGVSGLISFRRARTTIDPLTPHKSSALVVTGVYQYSRNPMYLAVAVCLFALAVYLAAPVSFVGIACFVGYITRFQVLPEERVLTQIFGDEYVAYQARVRRWI